MKNLSKYDNDLAVPTKEKVVLAMVKIAQAENFLTFTCDTIPTDDINILVSIQEAAI